MSSTTSGPKPTVAMLVPRARRSEVFTPSAIERLGSFARVIAAGEDTAAIAQRLPKLLPEADACMTGWGSPPLTPELLERAPRLKIITHSAGSIKRLIPVEAFERGIVVSHAADIIAEAVCECTLLMTLTGLRRMHLMDRTLKACRPWSEARQIFAGHQLAGSHVGLVGCGYVARKVIGLLKPFDVTIRVYDPYLSAERAAELGVISTSLDEVMARSTVVSDHAPITPETRHLIGAAQLARLRDGAIFVNTARAWTVDYGALLQELRTGRIWAALDVFEEEPLPEDSPFRQLENVFVTPHEAGHTVETYQKQGTAMVDELERFFAGQPLKYQIAPSAYAIMA